MLQQAEGVVAFKWFLRKWCVLLPYITTAAECELEEAEQEQPSSASELTCAEKTHQLVEWQVSRWLQ
jgi:hypothetical protein